MNQTRGEDEQPLLDVQDVGDGDLDRKAVMRPVVDDASCDEGDSGRSTMEDARFNPPPPSPWKRFALVLLIASLFYFGFHMRSALQDKKPKVIYASRYVRILPMHDISYFPLSYSKEHKFRPAASPVLTETLKDGRVRVRGALPTPTATPSPTKTAAKKRRSSKAGRVSGKPRRKNAPAVARQ